MRISVVFPAPLWPISATDSPRSTRNDTPASAHAVAGANGYRRERQPESAGGKYFSRFSTTIAGEAILGSYNRIRRGLSSSRGAELKGRWRERRGGFRFEEKNRVAIDGQACRLAHRMRPDHFAKRAVKFVHWLVGQ